MTPATKKLIAVGVVCASLTQIGNIVKPVQYVLGIGDAAYGGQATAQKVDEEFKQYLSVQKASTEAIQGYIASQQQAPVVVAPAPDQTQELSDDGEVKELIWTDRHGKRHHECLGMHDEKWPWDRKTKCVR